MTAKADPGTSEFTWVEGLAFCFAMIGIQLSSELIGQWGLYFYAPPADSGRLVYISLGIVGVVFVGGRVFDVITDPLVGMWSDRMDTARKPGRKFSIAGRRRPFLFWGSILMTLTGIMFWFPPVAATSSANFAYAGLLLCHHWLFFTLCYVPLHALAPEVARSTDARMRLGRWIGIGMTVGLAAAIVLPGILIVHLDPARSAEVEGYSPVGYQRVAVVFALVSLALLQFLVWTVRERYTPPPEKPAHLNPIAELKLVFKNHIFLLYFAIFGLFYTGYFAAQRVLPYWAEVGLGGDEETVTLLAAPFVLTSLGTALICPVLTRRFSIKTLMILSLAIISFGMPLMYAISVADVPTNTKIAMGAALFALTGVGQGIMYVLLIPLLGFIIDYDADRTGRRRDAVYNGITSITAKGANALGIIVVWFLMNTFGNELADPLGVQIVGPVSGLFGLAGLIVAFYYPRDAAPVSKL